MFLVLKPLKDAYITDRVVKDARSYGSNVGAAGSLDLFKLYGVTLSGSNPNVELSRLLIKFDLQPLRDLIAAGKIDPNNSSFNCCLKLFDVDGGQTVPDNFSVTVYPLSRSFDEGLGRDVVFYADLDVCNFLTGSRFQGSWLASGCNLGGGLPGNVDYATASSGVSLLGSQTFVEGTEDLQVDVTTAISATLATSVPDEGFRIALAPTHENDNQTYFVKRFGGRKAFNEAKRPRLIVKFDDSIQDDSQSLYLDSTSVIFLHNYVRQAPANLTSGSALTPITGSSSLILKLQTEISGGVYELAFTGSQHLVGLNPATGVYSASVYLPSSDAVFKAKLALSSSIQLTPIWGSLDDTFTFLTGSSIYAFPAQRSGASMEPKKFTVSAFGLKQSHPTDDEPVIRVQLADISSPVVKATRRPVELPGIVIRDVHYQVRNAVTNLVEIPFDTVHNSTRLSSDTNGMYFKLRVSGLTVNKSYVIDVLILTGNGDRQVYRDASPVFLVSDLR